MAEKQFQKVTGEQKFWNKTGELKEGDAVEGEVLMVQEARTAKASRTAVLKLENGESISVWLSAVLDGTFRSSVVVGDTVRITYKGKGTTKSGAEFNDYEVEVAKAEA